MGMDCDIDACFLAQIVGQCSCLTRGTPYCQLCKSSVCRMTVQEVKSNTIRGSNIYMNKGINSATHLAAVANITSGGLTDDNV